jgi:hypothetical protein
MKIQTVGVEYVLQIWSAVAPYIERALQYTDDYNLDQVKVFITNGSWILLVAVDDLQQIHGVATVAFNNDVNYRTAFITTIGGKGIIKSDTFGQMVNILRRMGATRIQGYARDSLTRLYIRHGLNNKANLVEIKL